MLRPSRGTVAQAPELAITGEFQAEGVGDRPVGGDAAMPDTTPNRRIVRYAARYAEAFARLNPGWIEA